MATTQEHLVANRIPACEGDIVAIDFATANATTIDLADADVLGTKCVAGHRWEMAVSVACVYKFSLPSSTTDVVNTSRTTASANGGPSQGYPLAAGEKFQFFFSRMFDASGQPTGFATELSIRGDAATGVVRIARISQTGG
jgi:hypothetical protein